MNCGPFARFAFGPDPPSVRFDDFLGQGEAQPAADQCGPCLHMSLIESFKDVWEIFRRNARSRIRYRHANDSYRGVRHHSKIHRSSFRAELEGVGKQIIQDLFDPEPVCRDPQPSPRSVNQDLNALSFSQKADFVH